MLTRACRTISAGHQPVAWCDEQDRGLAQQCVRVPGLAPAEDLATVHPVEPGLEVDASIEGGRSPHLHRERAGVAGEAGSHLGEAHHVVEGRGHEASVQAAWGTL